MFSSRFYLTVTYLALFCASAAKADLVFFADLDKDTPGVQSSRELATGQVFDVQIWLELSNSTSIDLYGVSVTYDKTELFLNLSNSFETPIPNFESFRDLSITGNGSFVEGIDAGTLANAVGTGPTAPAGSTVSFVVATLQFTAINPNGTSADVDIGFREGVFDGSFDNGQQPLLPVFVGASVISAVPESSSVALALIALALGVPTIRKRYRLRLCPASLGPSQ